MRFDQRVGKSLAFQTEKPFGSEGGQSLPHIDIPRTWK